MDYISCPPLRSIAGEAIGERKREGGREGGIYKQPASYLLRGEKKEGNTCWGKHKFLLGQVREEKKKRSPIWD